MESNIDILSILIEQKEIISSWGFCNEVLFEDRLQFYVQGFIFKGNVIVIFNRVIGSFSVRLEDTSGNLQAEITDIPLSELVSTIDGLVEKNCSQEEYAKRVMDEYERDQQ